MAKIDDSVKKKVPELRFKGFTDEWEERKLKDIAQFNPKTVLPDEFEYVDLESVVGTEMISHRTESKDQAPSRAQRLAQKGDVFYQTVRPYQMNNYLYDLPYDNYVFSTGYAQMRPNIDSYFLLNSVQNKQFVQHVLDRSTGTSYPAINSSDLSNIEIHVPSKLSEQQKIGSFFKQLDDTVVLHQRKLDLLKEQKKGYLQKMFPKNGAKVPELRFAGFADAWEQRKLGEIAIRVRGNDGRMNLPTLTISAGNGWMDQRDRFSQNIAGKEQKNYTLLRQGELSYNHGNSKLAQFGAVFELESYNEALVPRVYHSFSVTAGAQPKFIEQMFATHRPDRELRKLVSSGARMDGLLNINYDDFMGIKVWLPSVAEQQAIAGLLVKLDNTIALHQRKLDLLKEQKKGFLQNMFV
ncbi:hypothetical protein AYR54_11620 (plasmid) [Loigolactobacillus backii]|uniref:restriction endonuclease subunit S n=1 Tax=Loigolactobacillus backii TaxID=375175 RepID=UPI0007F11774|nr:restriction endonuclease subunit S [Loigolactobacillus backii]ANK65968.1 hypothetical protein AYR54_11620 [Loigolactobacillus backii]